MSVILFEGQVKNTRIVDFPYHFLFDVIVSKTKETERILRIIKNLELVKMREANGKGQIINVDSKYGPRDDELKALWMKWFDVGIENLG